MLNHDVRLRRGGDSPLIFVNCLPLEIQRLGLANLKIRSSERFVGVMEFFGEDLRGSERKGDV